MSVNKVILLGHIGSDPDVFSGENNGEAYKIVRCNLATNLKWKDKSGNKKEHTEWHSLVFRKGLANVAEKYIKKGSHIYVEGFLRTKGVEKDGKTSYYTSVYVQNLNMLDKMPREEQASTPDFPDTPANNPSPETQESESTNVDDDLPF